MKAILNLIQKQKEVTGLSIISNPFDFGSCDVVDRNGKSLFRGDMISCQVFINKEYEKIILSNEINPTPS